MYTPSMKSSHENTNHHQQPAVVRSKKRTTPLVVIGATLFLLLWKSGGFVSATGITLFLVSVFAIFKMIFSRGQRLKYLAVALPLFALAVIVMPEPAVEQNQSAAVATTTSQQSTDELRLAEAAKLKLQQQQASERAAQEKQAAQQRQDLAQQTTQTGDLYQVTSITDGDTIKVQLGDTIETIRFIGMDTPETKDPRKPVQCFGKEASSRMQHYVQSKKVRLESDPSQGDRDKYGRLLRYVYGEDGQNIAYEMIKGGYAHEYTYRLPYKYQSQFQTAEKQARGSSAGLWSSATCSGETNQQHPPAPAPAPQPAPKPQPAAQPRQSPQASSVYYKNCTAARAAGAAPVYAGQPGYGVHLDRDRDGIGCE